MREGLSELTDREREVLRLLYRGHTAKSAAAELDLSVHTINDHLREARKKLGVPSSKQAARILGEEGSNLPPKKLVPSQIGMDSAASQADVGLTGSQQPDRKRTGWIIGGIVMLSLLGAALLYTVSTGVIMGDEAQTEMVQTSEDKAAQRVALKWIALIDRGEWEASWQEAGKTFRRAVSSEDWAGQVEPVRAPLGSVISREVQTQTVHDQLPGAPAGTYRIVQFATDFSIVPDTTETVILMLENGSWKVAGYFIK